MKKQPIDFEAQLHTVPVRNERVEVEPAEYDPEVLVAQVALRYKGIMSLAKKLLNSRPYKRYELAGLTRELYEKLDGKLTVEDLIVDLQAAEKLTFFESRAFVVQYLKGLMQRGLIVIIAQDEDSDER